MLPEEQWLVKCPNCKSLLWVDEQKISTEVDEGLNEPEPYLVPEFNDSGSIGPPLPKAQELIQFICYEALFTDDEFIIQKKLRAFLGPIKGLK
jgi:hypothetical protein